MYCYVIAGKFHGWLAHSSRKNVLNFEKKRMIHSHGEWSSCQVTTTQTSAKVYTWKGFISQISNNRNRLEKWAFIVRGWRRPSLKFNRTISLRGCTSAKLWAITTELKDLSFIFHFVCLYIQSSQSSLVKIQCSLLFYVDNLCSWFLNDSLPLVNRKDF